MRESALVVSADVPWPPDGGGRIASLRVIEALGTRFDVDLLALQDPAVPLDPKPLRDRFRSVELVPQPFTFGHHRMRQTVTLVRSLFGLEPYRITKFRNKQLRKLIDDRVARRTYAVVHYEQLGVAPYRVTDLPTTLSHQNVEAHLYRMGALHAASHLRKTLAALEAAKLVRLEPRLIRGFDRVLVLSEHDRGLLAHSGVSNVSVVPIPVVPVKRPAPPPATATVLTVGTMSWFGVEDGLLWFRHEVWPKIRERLPNARWTLAGANAGPRIKAIDGSNGVEVLGYADDLHDLVARSRLLVVPLFIGGGIRIKLLETMAQGRPFVATSVGALGLHLAEGEGGYVRDDPSDFAAAAIRLLTDDGEWTRAGARGIEFVKSHHTPAITQAVVMEAIDRARAHHARA